MFARKVGFGYSSALWLGTLVFMPYPNMLLRPAESDGAMGVARVHVRSWQAAYRTLFPMSIDLVRRIKRKSMTSQPVILSSRRRS